MTSRTTFGNFEIVLGQKGSLRFAKRPSNFNVCIADQMRGKTFESRQKVQEAFKSAVSGCKPQSPATEEVVETVE